VFTKYLSLVNLSSHWRYFVVDRGSRKAKSIKIHGDLNSDLEHGKGLLVNAFKTGSSMVLNSCSFFVQNLAWSGPNLGNTFIFSGKPKDFKLYRYRVTGTGLYV